MFYNLTNTKILSFIRIFILCELSFITSHFQTSGRNILYCKFKLGLNVITSITITKQLHVERYNVPTSITITNMQTLEQNSKIYFPLYDCAWYERNKAEIGN